jgi:monoamine oxidase
MSLDGVRVIVAGAGLAGLTAARTLSRNGADVRVVEARDRVGGRAWTFRRAPVEPFHAELGGEFIDKEHKAIRKLCKELDVELVRVLRRGFGTALEQRGRTRIFASQTPLWALLTDSLKSHVKVFSQEQDWTATASAAIARHSVRDVLTSVDAEPRLHAFASALRGLFLADPEDLSALVVVEQIVAGNPGRVEVSRVKQGTDKLVKALQKDARCTVDLGHAVRAVSQDSRGVAVTVEGPGGKRAVARADYVIAAVPAPLLLEWTLSPQLPPAQREALTKLTYGKATKAILRFSRRWWRAQGRPRAFGTNLSIGAVWETAEEQKKAAMMSLLAGGRASDELREILEREGGTGISKRLRWLGGGPREAPQLQWVSWDRDPWARGGYEYFSPAFDPALRDLIARGAGRLLFAGSHTSRDFQGYMNGAVESGLRAAGEVEALQRIGG